VYQRFFQPSIVQALTCFLSCLIGKDEYERMVTALKQLESESIMHDIQQGLNDIQQGKTQPIA
jgi:hypothetical protein